ncbi:DAK2 domain-containing protein [Mycoplasma leonicaptivi]|uniref:DAK2 domain-containing protein n=1 Tax=Mycoplasma leonicaptivi TaxID=36742 RepID=UPI0004838148|nr:DAK2 domain-containing protein [Mycoplasma leonicaptivi]
MNKKILNGYEFANALISGANSLRNSKNRIDALNVFPVPDGDTGTNMSATAMSVVEPLSSVSENVRIDEVAKIVSQSMIYEARGNSGVILSQIFKGFSLGVTEKEALDLNELLDALNSAVDRAYKSVFKPVEGTILTVIRETTEFLNLEFRNQKQEVSIQEFFKKLLEFARKSCNETPNKLKTLREVGVTDSGGEGLYEIFRGMLQYFIGEPVEISDKQEDILTFLSEDEVYDGEFGYCTEVLVDLFEFETFDKNAFTSELEKIANSLVVVTDDNILKVHGHTEKPGDLLNLSQKYGEFIKIKSENMTLQANNSKANKQKFNETSKQIERVQSAVVSCNLGSGIIQRMKDLGCDYIVESGQTQNPSAQDLINAIKSTNAETVFILPNNSNVILVAQQAAQVVQDTNVIVIPTKTQIQGMTAMLNYNPEFDNQTNIELMSESIENVQTGEITKAVRDTKINGVQVNNGDYLAIHDHKIVASNKDWKDSVKYLIKKMIKPTSEIISIFYGDESDQRSAEEIGNFIESKYNIEIEIIAGNQPNYDFLIGVE